MLRRLMLGLLKGGLVGGTIAASIVFWLGVASMTGAFAYLSVMVAGVLVAFIAGKPIWARGAWVEVLLKAIAAAALSAGLLFLLQRYMPGDLTLGSTRLAEMPLFFLPSIATLLAVFFEVDNDDEEQVADSTSVSKRSRVDDTAGTLTEQDTFEEEAEPRSRQVRS